MADGLPVSEEFIWNLRRLVRDGYPKVGLPVADLVPRYKHFFPTSGLPRPSAVSPGCKSWTQVFQNCDQFKVWFRISKTRVIHANKIPESDLEDYFRHNCYQKYIGSRVRVKSEAPEVTVVNDGAAAELRPEEPVVVPQEGPPPAKKAKNGSSGKVVQLGGQPPLPKSPPPIQPPPPPLPPPPTPSEGPASLKWPLTLVFQQQQAPQPQFTQPQHFGFPGWPQQPQPQPLNQNFQNPYVGYPNWANVVGQMESRRPPLLPLPPQFPHPSVPASSSYTYPNQSYQNPNSPDSNNPWLLTSAAMNPWANPIYTVVGPSQIHPPSIRLSPPARRQALNRAVVNSIPINPPPPQTTDKSPEPEVEVIDEIWTSPATPAEPVKSGALPPSVPSEEGPSQIQPFDPKLRKRCIKLSAGAVTLGSHSDLSFIDNFPCGLQANLIDIHQRLVSQQVPSPRVFFLEIRAALSCLESVSVEPGTKGFDQVQKLLRILEQLPSLIDCHDV